MITLVEIVPSDVQTPLVLLPVNGKQGCPNTHHDGKESIKWTTFRIVKQVVKDPTNEAKNRRRKDPLQEKVHPFKVDGNLLPVVLSDKVHRHKPVLHCFF
jgi:hypothetical protein